MSQSKNQAGPTFDHYEGGVFYFRKQYQDGSTRYIAVSETEARHAIIADNELTDDATMTDRARVCAKYKVAAIEELELEESHESWCWIHTVPFHQRTLYSCNCRMKEKFREHFAARRSETLE